MSLAAGRLHQAYTSSLRMETWATMSNADTLTLDRIPLFEGLASKQLKSLRGYLTSVRALKTGEVIREGAFGREFVVLTAGQATVRKGDEVVATLSAGDAFGEHALLTATPRNATVTVEAGSEMLVASTAEFHTILADFPEVAERLASLSAARN
jgi:CRP-like cAMP-binding protein